MKIDLQRVHGVIVGSFKLAEFRRLLKYRFDIDLEDEVGNVGFSEAVERILDLAEGRGILPELIAEIALERPKARTSRKFIARTRPPFCGYEEGTGRRQRTGRLLKILR